MGDFLAELDREIAAAEREMRASKTKLSALVALRKSYIGEQPGTNIRLSNSPAVMHALAILRERGSPIRTVELLPLVFSRGVHFSAKNKANVLSSLLSRCPEIVSLGGHIGWALREWGWASSASAMNVAAFMRADRPTDIKAGSIAHCPPRLDRHAKRWYGGGKEQGSAET